ncbi:MAG: Hercynine oxygenase [Chlamydiae bacterium]|nr:Hercynine oxygenase [Chlamydiota bacterium]
MRLKLFLCCLFVTVTVQAEPVENQKSRSIFAYTKSLGLGGQVRCLYDMIVLKDGTLLTGDVSDALALTHAFGDLGFDKDKVCLISPVSETSEKIRILTSNGKVYEGSVDKESVTFTEYVAVCDTSRHQSRTLSYDEVSFILFKPKRVAFIVNTEKKAASSQGDSEQKFPDGDVGLSFTSAVRSESKEDAIPEASGLEVVVAQPDKLKNEPPAIFTAQTELGIPEEVEFSEEPEPVFVVVGNDMDQMISDELLALGADFAIENWEPEGVQEDVVELSTSEEEIIISQDDSSADEIQQVDEAEEIAYLDVEEEEVAELANPIYVEDTLQEDDYLDTTDTPVEVLSVEGVYAGMMYIAPEENSPSGFYVNMRPVTNREYEEFVQAINYITPPHWLRGEIPPGFEDRPVVNISYRDVFLFAIWSGKRLPSEEELRRFAQEYGVEGNPDNNFREWTSTPSSNVSFNDKEMSNSLQSRSFHSGHLVFGPKQDVSIERNDEYNSHIGFRLAGDAQ